jgi:hypothetical protein
MQARKQNASCLTPTHSRWIPFPTAPRRRPPRYSFQYARVQTSGQSTTILKRRAGRAAAAASNEK